MEPIIAIPILLIALLVYGYLLSLVCSTAYFKAKLDYQTSFFLNFTKHSKKDGVVKDGVKEH